ncbi:unnamed protein product [Closterium sp. Yama58-4]|nr:unnamed protein product [Closterium sp. Yama58-4]
MATSTQASEARRVLAGKPLRPGLLPLKVEFAYAKGSTAGGGAPQPAPASQPKEKERERPRPGVRRVVWVGWGPAHVVPEEIDAEFRRFGPIEDLRFHPDRACAFVDYRFEDDAQAAVASINNVRTRDGGVFRVEFAKSGPHAGGGGGGGSGGGGGGGGGRGGGGGSGDGSPSEILWVGFPSTLTVTEERLHAAFSQHGQIRRIKTFPGRTYAFVEMATCEQATNAIRALDHVLFNDDRVHIRYSKSEFAFMHAADPPFSSPAAAAAAAAGGAAGVAAGEAFAVSAASPAISVASPAVSAAGPPMLGRPGLPGALPGPMPPPGPGSVPGGLARAIGASDGAGSHWKGTLAKGGIVVCHARAIPIGPGISAPMPDVLNCSARTELDTLAKHVRAAADFGVVAIIPEAQPDVPPYHDLVQYLGEKHSQYTLAKHVRAAADFGVVAIIPEAQPDVPPYHDLVQYLGEKRRAGVAKLPDGSTLFLVPPSDFAVSILQVPRNDSLFGVYLSVAAPAAPGAPAAPVARSSSTGARPSSPPYRAHAPSPTRETAFASQPAGSATAAATAAAAASWSINV